MPFPLRTLLVPKPSRSGFPWGQGPSTTTWSSLRYHRNGFGGLLEGHKDRGASFLPLLLLPCISQRWCQARRLLPPTRAITWERQALLAFGAIIQRKQGISFITLKQAPILHGGIFHISALIPQISLLNPASAFVVCHRAPPGQLWKQSTWHFHSSWRNEQKIVCNFSS